MRHEASAAQTARSGQDDAAVYLDFDNLVSNDAPDAAGQWIERLMSFLRAKHRLCHVAAYGDWQKMAAWYKTLDGMGVECIHVSSNTRGGKNSADLEATVDVMEMVRRFLLLHLAGVQTRFFSPQALTTGRDVPNYVLCTGDADFRPLCKRLRRYGKHVAIVTWAVSASQRLSAVCDDMVFIDDLVGTRAASTADLQQCAATLRSALQAMLADPAHTAESGGGGAVVLPGAAVWRAAKHLDSSLSYARFGYSSWYDFLQVLSVSHPEIVLHPGGEGGSFGVSLDLTRVSQQAIATSAGPTKLLEALRDLAASKGIPAGHLPQAVDLGAALPMFVQCVGVTLALEGERGVGLPRLRTKARSVGMQHVGGREEWGSPPPLDAVGLTADQAASMRSALSHVTDEVQNAIVSLVIMLLGTEAPGTLPGTYYAQKSFRAADGPLADPSPENVNKAMAAKAKNKLRSAGAPECMDHIDALLYTHRTPSHTAAAAAAPAVPPARLGALKTQRERRASLSESNIGQGGMGESGRAVAASGSGARKLPQGSSTSITSSMDSGSWRDADPERTPRGDVFQAGFHKNTLQGGHSAQSSSRSLGGQFKADTAPSKLQSSRQAQAPPPAPALAQAPAPARDHIEVLKTSPVKADTHAQDPGGTKQSPAQLAVGEPGHKLAPGGGAGKVLPWKHATVAEAQKALGGIARAAYTEGLKAWRLPGLATSASHLPLAGRALCGVLLSFSTRGEHLTPPAIRTNLISIGNDYVDGNPSFGAALKAADVELTVDEAKQLREVFSSVETNALNALVTVVTHLLCVNMSGSDVGLGKRRLQLQEQYMADGATAATLNAQMVTAIMDWLRKHAMGTQEMRDVLQRLLVLQPQAVALADDDVKGAAAAAAAGGAEQIVYTPRSDVRA